MKKGFDLSPFSFYKNLAIALIIRKNIKEVESLFKKFIFQFFNKCKRYLLIFLLFLVALISKLLLLQKNQTKIIRFSTEFLKIALNDLPRTMQKIIINYI